MTVVDRWGRCVLEVVQRVSGALLLLHAVHMQLLLQILMHAHVHMLAASHVNLPTAAVTADTQ